METVSIKDAIIPFNRPSFNGEESVFLADALQSRHVAGDGVFTKKCHEILESVLGVPRVFLTTSCTHALEMCALLIDIVPGDEVIVPSFTFVSTINAFVLRGAVPVFIDIRPDTFNMDEGMLPDLITPRTRAILPVHYAGVACEMDAVCPHAEKHGIPVIEDNAHGLFAKYKGKHLGTFGAMATQSFHETKNFTCGEGGALLINDTRFVERAEILREKGTDRSRFFRGQVDKYSWVDVGSSYLPSDILAAILYAQFIRRESIQQRRKEIWLRYEEGLNEWAHRTNVRLPVIPADCEQAYHIFHLLLPTHDARTALIRYLKDRGIQSAFHYLPLHLSPMGTGFGGYPGMCPVSEDISGRLLRLPFYENLTVDEQSRIISAVCEFTC